VPGVSTRFGRGRTRRRIGPASKWRNGRRHKSGPPGPATRAEPGVLRHQSPSPDYYGDDRKAIISSRVRCSRSPPIQQLSGITVPPHDIHAWGFDASPVLGAFTIGGQRHRVVMRLTAGFSTCSIGGSRAPWQAIHGTNWAREIGADGRPGSPRQCRH
jgi:hypothetical protein